MPNIRLITRIVSLFTFLSALSSGSLFAAAAITGAVNAASNLPPGVPNYGIAQGAIFIIYGSNLGPAVLLGSPLPLPTTAGLAGTTVTVTVGGFGAAVPVLYTSGTQIAAIMPSNTPPGFGNLIVTYNGSTAGIPVTVVKSNAGIFTVNQAGTGQAVATFADYSLVTSAKPARPGDTLILWATGLGAINGSDAVGAPFGTVGAPVQVLVGGAPGAIRYQGRSPGLVGLDQINFVVPAGALGCAVSLVVQTGNLFSNSTSISVSPDGGVCSDPNAPLPQSFLSALPANSFVRMGAFHLEQATTTIPAAGSPFGVTTTKIAARANFMGITRDAIPTLLNPGAAVSFGSCAMVASTPVLSTRIVLILDAGASLSLGTPSAGAISLAPQDEPGSYLANFFPLDPGTYTVSNGGGGRDVAGFTTNFAVPQLPVWSAANQASIGAGDIDRTLPLTIAWTGGDANSYVDIVIRTGTNAVNVWAECTAPATAGSFTIPASVLLSLPAGGQLGSFGTLTVSASAKPRLWTAGGLDAFVAEAHSSNQIPVSFK